MRQLKNFSGPSDKNVNSDSSDPVIPSIDKYDGLTREQLLDTLKRAVFSAKRDDSYDPETIEDFCNFVSPMLDDDGKERLKEVMSLLEEQ